MAVILTVMHGPSVGERFEIVEGAAPTMIGRGLMCAIRMEDAYVSESHAALFVAQGRLTIRDLGSQSGTWVNDQQILPEAVLQEGDRVQIGQTLFVVGGEAARAEGEAGGVKDPLAALAAAFQMTERDQARFALQAEPGTVYAIVDLAADPGLLEMLNGSGEQFCALDETVEPDALGDVAPCLVSFSRGSVLLGQLMESVWGTENGMFFASEQPFTEVYARYVGMMSYDEEGNLTSARFWSSHEQPLRP